MRELRNLIERAVILSRAGDFDLEEAMPGDTSKAPAATCTMAQRGFIREEDWQRSYRDNIIAALDACGWRISGKRGAADLLGINVSTLRGRMKTLDIPMPGDRV